MSDQSRSLPPSASLRFLKLEARRRLTAGEFDTLHNAQLAIAREHGMSSWAVLKQAISSQTSDSHALAHVRWLISRFSGADAEGWEPPSNVELHKHFHERFLAEVRPWRLVATAASRAPMLRKELVVLEQKPLAVQAQVGGLRIDARAEADPAHRLAGLLMYPVGARVADPRVARPPAGCVSGDVPAQVSQIADEALAEVGLPGLVLAGGIRDTAWATARGWADLDRPDALRPEHRFPVPGVTKLITAVGVLRLAAGGRVDLDDPANTHLHTVRLADDAVTVRELLTHTGGTDRHPAELFADTVPDLASVTGPLLTVSERGTFKYSNTGYAALGQLIADVTGSAYAEAVAGLVLEPLAMTAASFPTAWPTDDPNAVTGYRLLADGIFATARRQVCTMPAAAGLWATAADLIRFATGWSSLLPDSLAREALTPHADLTAQAGQMGLGWMLDQEENRARHSGNGPWGSASLTIQVSTGQATVALTNRQVPIEPVNARVIRALTELDE
jgi:CubicO group peptidase (beta-lactamase class C family)